MLLHNQEQVMIRVNEIELKFNRLEIQLEFCNLVLFQLQRMLLAQLETKGNGNFRFEIKI